MMGKRSPANSCFGAPMSNGRRTKWVRMAVIFIEYYSRGRDAIHLQAALAAPSKVLQATR
jgi:hypothetical protein